MKGPLRGLRRQRPFGRVSAPSLEDFLNEQLRHYVVKMLSNAKIREEELYGVNGASHVGNG
jgi:hypothetical protein